MIRRRTQTTSALAVLALGFALAGCWNPFSPRIAPVLGRSEPAPVPSSATGVLRLFEWCYNHQAIAEYREIFTDDYRFFFSPTDSSGAEWRGTPYTREDEMISATNLFVGGSATEPPASSIRLTLDKNFVQFPDPYYQTFDPSGVTHKSIRTAVTLLIGTDDGGQTEITGHARFYVIRGDSAVIPQELKDKGFTQDANRWYIRRWDDETGQDLGAQLAAHEAAAPVAGGRRAGPATIQPGAYLTWGYIKNYYRNLPVVAAPITARR